MDLMRIINIKMKLLKEIEEAAKKGDTYSIISNSKILEVAKEIINKMENIEYCIKKLEEQIASESVFKGDEVVNIPHSEVSYKEKGGFRSGFSYKGKGEFRRNEFIRRLSEKGIQLSHVKGILYKTKHEKLIGIASASERISNRWFLGLPQKNYWSIVLLCENNEKDTIIFVLPEDFIRKYKNKMSHDETGEQIKFNVSLKGSICKLLIPKEEPADITKFKDNFDLLR